MPSGLRLDTDLWVRNSQDAKQLADEVVASIQERNTKFRSGGSEASRMTAAARRKLGILGTKIEDLTELLNSAECANLTANERNRRSDLLMVLNSRKEQMASMLSRHQAERDSLFTQPGSSAPAQETDRTAELDNRGILQLQQQVMQEQDQDLEELSHTVNSTKHIAVTIGEELDLQNRLLDELDEDVEVTASRLTAARKRITQVLKKSNNCKIYLFIILLVVILMFVISIGFKL